VLSSRVNPEPPKVLSSSHSLSSNNPDSYRSDEFSRGSFASETSGLVTAKSDVYLNVRMDLRKRSVFTPHNVASQWEKDLSALLMACQKAVPYLKIEHLYVQFEYHIDTVTELADHFLNGLDFPIDSHVAHKIFELAVQELRSSSSKISGQDLALTSLRIATDMVNQGKPGVTGQDVANFRVWFKKKNML
jgi:hypothetical protein